MTDLDGSGPSLAFVPCVEIREFLMSRIGQGQTVDELLSNLRRSQKKNEEERKAFQFLDLYQIIDLSFVKRIIKSVPVLFIPEPVHFTKSLRWSSSRPRKGETSYRILDFASIPDDATLSSDTRIKVRPFRYYLHHEDGSKYYWKLPMKSAGAFLTIALDNNGGLKEPMCEKKLLVLLDIIMMQAREDSDDDGEDDGEDDGGDNDKDGEGDGEDDSKGDGEDGESYGEEDSEDNGEGHSEHKTRRKRKRSETDEEEEEEQGQGTSRGLASGRKRGKASDSETRFKRQGRAGKKTQASTKNKAKQKC
ncbi:hypothetical protein BDP27DRAFT_1332906, partial [Rhodocollybia butyracea]